MTVEVDPTLISDAESMSATKDHVALSTGRRFFHCDDNGISYSVVARDQEHAEKLLRDSGIEFPMIESKDKDGNPSLDAQYAEPPEWREYEPGRPATIRVHKEIVGMDGRHFETVVTLDQCDMEEWFSSEF